MKLTAILDALHEGAVLHFSLAKKPRWELYQPGTIATVSSRQVQSLLRQKAIKALGDTLFAEVPSQTWHHDSACSGGAP